MGASDPDHHSRPVALGPVGGGRSHRFHPDHAGADSSGLFPVSLKSACTSQVIRRLHRASEACHKKKPYWASLGRHAFFSNSAYCATFCNGLFPDLEEVRIEDQKNIRTAKMISLFLQTDGKKTHPIKTGCGMDIPINQGGGQLLFDSMIRLGLQALYQTHYMPCP